MLADNVQKLGSHGMLTKTQMTDVSMFGVVHFIENKNIICITIAIISTPETQFSEPQFSEILDIIHGYTVIPRFTRFSITRFSITRFFDHVQINLYNTVL